ncbi:MAG: tetratricopeptide repeat protein, partial [Tannerella sp.]|nr:tetratricopeptide repeat protein [Tannerella sp.]
VTTLAKTTLSAFNSNSHEEADANMTQLFTRIRTTDYLTADDIAVLKEMLLANALTPQSPESLQSPEASQIFPSSPPSTLSQMSQMSPSSPFSPSSPSPAPGYLSAANCQIVVALMLGLQEIFDEKKLYLLFDAAESPDAEVSIRAFIGIFITLYTHSRRAACYPAIAHRIEHLAGQKDSQTIAFLVNIQFITSRDTEKITSKIQDEILPEMLKFNTKLFSKWTSKGKSFETMDEDNFNPDWEEKISANANLRGKMEEYQRLQEDGADVMHSTFVHLKNFEFFKNLSHWFLPFHTGIPPSQADTTVIGMLEILSRMKYMCNSDLYSFYFSILHLPEAGREKMLEQLTSRFAELETDLKTELFPSGALKERIIKQFVQDLFRFHKLHPRKGDFNDIFTLKLDFHNVPSLNPFYSDSETLANIAEKYMRSSYFEDARIIYAGLTATPSGDGELYQKKGYCEQMLGNYRDALADYLHAELFDTESKWLMRRTAQCYRATKKPDKAIEYYLRHERKEPGNLQIMLGIGACYLDLKNYGEALKYYFKADYLDTKSHKAWRPIAWCSFLTGKFEQAQNYYAKIIDNSPDTQDYMNAGHTEWALQNIKGAIAFYSRALQAADNNYEDFRKEFNHDIPDLVASGISPEEIPLVLDKLIN